MRKDQTIALAAGSALALVGAGLIWLRKRGVSVSQSGFSLAPEPATSDPKDDPVVGPAYSYLSKWTPAERRALYNAQKKLGLDIAKGALPGVIQHESGGDPGAPKQATGTPRAGLIQLTQGARLDGYRTADEVWAARSLSITEQLDKIVVPLWGRFGNLGAATLVTMLRKNFLPGVADKPASFVIGVRPAGMKDSAGTELPEGVGPSGEKPGDLVTPKDPKLTLGAVYKHNRYYDPSNRGYFTWADADSHAAITEAKAKGQWITVSGKIVSSPHSQSPISGAGSSDATSTSVGG